ncbi:hypothetical protein [Brachybacterium kimchii]|uniref:Large polyvalent protein associated domain-containing protein n=1 Tax=Brachybacterium kimchii TaxID=2942909 RepID=A0ABY4NAW4_9MICO|nr:hypothetical protein [Brachybacterium kimchii]UQN30514.1 hypothetical protein M4486_04175 [Brachybacterium kimchii]
MASKRRGEVGMNGNGGQFAPVGRTEADVHVATDQEIIDALPHSPDFFRPVLNDRDGAEADDFGLDGYASTFSCWFDHEDGRTRAEVTVFVPDRSITGTRDPDTASYGPEDEADAQEASVVLDQVLRDRYPGADISYDAEDPQLSWEYSTEGLTSREQMYQTAWDAPGGPVTFANEADVGTFGHESLGRLFRERITSSAMTRTPTMYDSSPSLENVTAADRENDSQARAQFDDSEPVDLPTDANVRRYARRLADGSDQMKMLSEHGCCDAERALSEVDDVTSAPGGPGRRQMFEVHQLRTWVERSRGRLSERWGN